MRKLIVSVFALSLLGATAAQAEVGVGVHIGGVGVHVGAGGHDDRGRHHRRCSSWGWHRHHHDRYCRRWSW